MHDADGGFLVIFVAVGKSAFGEMMKWLKRCAIRFTFLCLLYVCFQCGFGLKSVA